MTKVDGKAEAQALVGCGCVVLGALLIAAATGLVVMLWKVVLA